MSILSVLGEEKILSESSAYHECSCIGHKRGFPFGETEYCQKWQPALGKPTVCSITVLNFLIFNALFHTIFVRILFFFFFCICFNDYLQDMFFWRNKKNYEHSLVEKHTLSKALQRAEMVVKHEKCT